MDSQKYDLVVIGAGPGGYVAAIRAAQLGISVAVVEKEPALGGTCLRIGCIPSKMLLESSELFTMARNHFARHGIQTGEVKLDLPTMMRRKEQVVTQMSRGVESLFKKHKITRHLGHGCLAGPGRVTVESKGQSTSLESRNIILATGSRAATLPGIEWDRIRIGSSTEALSYTEPPPHLVVIGAGFIGLELGSVWRRLGSKVTVLEYMDRILPGMDDEIAAEAKKLFEKQGLEFRLGVKVTGAKVEGNQCVVQVENQEPVTCDKCLVAVGRRPNTEDLGLEAVGVKLDGKGRIDVDANFMSSAPGVYAIGDVIRGPMLAHKAEEEGVACAEQLATGQSHVDYNTIPGVVYTDPEIATVGKNEAELRELGREYRKGWFPFRANGRAHSIGQVEGKVKILADKHTDRILGVHIIGPRAGDLIAEAVTAMALGASSEDIARICHAHPTLSEAFREAALAVDGRAIHF
jgi:dihydrolipoamide dehydrogenase